MNGKLHPTTTPDWEAAVQRRTRFTTLIAAILAVLFGILLYSSLIHQDLIVKDDLVPAIFAAVDIPAGVTITADMLAKEKVPEGLLTSSSYSYPEQIIGRQAIYPFIRGELILSDKLVGIGGGPVSGRCPDGMWCVQVPVSWFIADPPDLIEGDRIEIASVLPGDDPENRGFIVTGGQVIFQINHPDNQAIVIAVDSVEALSLLFAVANQFQLLVLVQPPGGQ